MKSRFFHFTLYAIIVYLACTTLNLAVAAPTPSEENQTHFCGFDDCRLDNRRYARVRANLKGDVGADLNVGEPRTVRMIYFLPNDRPFRAEVVQRMKDEIRNIQTFYAEQMGAHGYGNKTFRFETAPQGEPMVHRVDGQHPDSHYLDNTEFTVGDEIGQAFDFSANVYLIVIDNSQNSIGRGGGETAAGVGGRRGKNAGWAWVPGGFGWEVVVHELGHAFGLGHDFRDGAYIMSYGPGRNRLSPCSAEFLAVHPYFNPNLPIEDGQPPTIELISLPKYPAGSKNASVQLTLSDSDGLHQVLLHVTPPNNRATVKACRGLASKKHDIVQFEYDGVIPSAHDGPYSRSTSLLNPLVHPIQATVVDIFGNVSWKSFVMFSETLQSLTKISGDNQPPSFPNAPLPVPFVVEVRDVNNGSARQGVWVTFTVTGGGGTLSAERVMTDSYGRAESTLTLGPNLGRNTVEVSAAGSTVTFTAVAERTTVNIPDSNLRSTIEKILNKSLKKIPGDPIAPAEMATLTELYARVFSISDLTGLELATNLTHLDLTEHSISDISAVSGLTKLTSLYLGNNSISDISAVSGLTNLTWLYLEGNSISDISAVSGLTNLTSLNLHNNSISDISAVSGLTNLTSLSLSGNSISDISAVSGLTNLTSLGLGNNSISDISAVSGLTKLTELNLHNNSISDISAVSGLTNLTSLGLGGNSISDISAVSGLTNLTYLNLDSNSVSDISPLVENTGLAGEDEVGVRGNPLNYPSIHTHTPTLQERGVTVEFDNRVATTLLNISGVITESDNMLTVEVRDRNGRTFEGVPVTFTVTSGGGTLSVTSATTDEKGRAQSTLTLGSDGEPNRVKVSAVGTEQTVTFSDVAEAGVNIPDPNLRAAIENALGVTSGSPISPEKMATLTHFRAREASISLLIGLEFATNLTELRLGDNGITDISPLSGLTNLRTLGLGKNSVTDISPLSGLTNLRTLGLSNNGIEDVSALVQVLSGLTNLTELHLRDNRIRDISSLANLTNLTNLRLSYNQIEDISPLSGLTHLTELHLSGNRVRDISPISELTNLRRLYLPSGITDVPVLVRVLSSMTHLTYLNLSDSNIGDVSALVPVLSGLTNLIDLNLSGNGITDLSPLAVLTNLSSINLWNNNISDISPLLENTGLGAQGWGWVSVRLNPLSYQSIHTHIPTLQSRGVTVDFDDQAHPALLKTLGDNQRRMPGETLANPFVVEAQDEKGSALVGISVTFTVTEGGGALSIQTTATDTNGRAESTLTLGPNLGPNTVEVSATGIKVPVTFNAEGVGTPTRPLKLSGDDQQGPSGTQLAEPFVVEVRDQYDNPLPDVEVTFKVTAGGGTLSPQSTKTDADGRAESTLTLGSNPGINTVSVFVAGIEEVVTFNAIGEIEFNLSVPEGISLIHVPLQVTAVDRKPKTIESIGDLYDALGGSANVNVLITYNTQKQRWNSYLGDQYRGRPSDKALTDDLGIVASMKAAKSMLLSGDALGTNGNSSITLHPGTNLVGVPLRDSRITRVSDLFALEGIGDNVSVIIVSDDGFKVVAQAGDDGDIPIMGGGAFILTAREAATVAIEGGGWYNRLGPTAAPPMVLRGIEVEDTTPVLAVSGSIVFPVGGASLPRPLGSGFQVTVKNLSTSKSVATVTEDEGVDYQLTFVNTETGRAAQVGDILEITAQSPDPFVGVQPLRYMVTPTDVKRNHIPLDELVAYEIPAETELLLNYPNPFNPETWIPYRLAEDAFVRLTIYDLSGGLVRRIDVGHRIAAVYESRAKAVHWDGRNQFGERVASGIYFYHFAAGDYSATRKMVILK